MNIDVRACRPDELARYGEILSYVFAENDNELIQREIEATDPAWTHCAFDGDRMVGTMGVIPFTIQLNGRPISAGGVTGVGTLPEHRRKGILRRVMTSGLEVMKDRGQGVAILWASMGAIYQRFGYGLAAQMVRYTFDPRTARREHGPAPSGSCELLPRSEAEPLLKDIYGTFLASRNLLLHRSDFFWDNDLRTRDKKPRYIVVYRNGEGSPTGYAIYTTEETEMGVGPSQKMEVHDFIATDIDAYAGLWDYLCAHDLVGKVVMNGCVAEDDPAPDILSEPRMLNRWTGDAIWLRVTDLASVVPLRPYGAPGSLVFRIASDPECRWNEGTWRLETDGPTATLQQTAETAQLTVPMQSMASLIAGYRSATQLERIGRLSADDRDALKVADRLFATDYRPFLPNEF